MFGECVPITEKKKKKKMKKTGWGKKDLCFTHFIWISGFTKR